MRYGLIILSLFFHMEASLAFSRGGDSKGNGGGGWVCLENGKIDKIEVFDIYESEAIFGLTFNKNLNYAQAIEQGFTRLESLLSDGERIDLHNLWHYYNSRRIFVAESLDYTSDHAAWAMPNREIWCSNPESSLIMGQIVNYQDGESIFINRELYSHLTPFQRAAIDLHELVYSIRRRMYNDNFSLTTRKVVGLLLSEQDHEAELASYLLESFVSNRRRGVRW